MVTMTAGRLAEPIVHALGGTPDGDGFEVSLAVAALLRALGGSEITVPVNALLAEDGTPILTEDGEYILVETGIRVTSTGDTRVTSSGDTRVTA